MQSKHRTQRGSVILMVVGILSALAMMGTAFLLVTFADRQDAGAVSEAAPIRTVVEGLVQRACVELADDLRIGSRGPYSDFTGVAAADIWKIRIDYASNQADYGFDRHLASTTVCPVKVLDSPGVRRDSTWAKLTDPRCFNPDSDADVTDVKSNSGSLVDTDGDDSGDAVLFPTGVFSGAGTQYYAAVRIIDTSGLVNVNASYAAADNGESSGWMNVGMISPGRLPQKWSGSDDVRPLPFREEPFPVQAVFTTRMSSAFGRSGGGQFFDRYVRRMDNPLLAGRDVYRTYDLSDELACRWVDTVDWGGGGTIRSNPRMRASRLSRSIAGGADDSWSWRWAKDWAAYGRYLTTHSSGRTFARYSGDVDAVWGMPTPAKVDLNLLTLENDPADAYDTYRRAFYQMLPHLNESEREEQAAQLAVNLIDYLDGDTAAEDKVTIAPVKPGSSTEVMGIERQPFLTQAWYRVERKEKAAGDGDEGEPEIEIDTFMALVLHNPYEEKIEMRNWEVKVGAQSVKFTDSIKGGGYFVIHNSPDIKVADTAGRINTPVSFLDPSKDVLICRPAYKLSGAVSNVDVPVGCFKATEFAQQYTPGMAIGTFTSHMCRDETRKDLRVAVARYGTVAAPKDYVTDSTGIGTNVSFTKTDAINEIPPTPVFIRGYGGKAGHIWNLADLCRIYRIGPTTTEPLDVRLAEELGNTSTPAKMFAIGRLHSLDFITPKGGDYGYNLLPPFCLAADYFTVDSPTVDGCNNDGDKIGAADVTDPNWTISTASWKAWNRETIQFGKININTASVAVLSTLPFLKPLAATYGEIGVAGDIVCYRDRLLGITDGGLGADAPRNVPYADRTRVLRTMLDGGTYRNDQAFASTGELAVLLRIRSTFSALLGVDWPAPTGYYPAYREGPDGGTDDGYGGTVEKDLTKLEMRYAYLSNCVSVNSDTYCAYVRIQLGDSPDAKVKRNYIAIIDRSNCVTVADSPVLRAFAEVK